MYGDVEVGIYEPMLKEDEFFHSNVIKDLDEFKNIVDVIVSNRLCKQLENVEIKFIRGIYMGEIRRGNV